MYLLIVSFLTIPPTNSAYFVKLPMLHSVQYHILILSLTLKAVLLRSPLDPNVSPLLIQRLYHQMVDFVLFRFETGYIYNTIVLIIRNRDRVYLTNTALQIQIILNSRDKDV